MGALVIYAYRFIAGSVSSDTSTMKMAVKFFTANLKEDPVSTSGNIPEHAQNDLKKWPQSEYFRGVGWGYLQQTIVGKLCSLRRYHFYMDHEKMLHSCSKDARITMVYITYNDVPCVLHGYGNLLLQREFMYLFYLPPGKTNDFLLSKGKHLIQHFDLTAELLNDISQDDERIAVLLKRVKEKSPNAIMAVKAPYSSFAKHCLEKIVNYNSKTDGYLNLFLNARALDLILDMLEEKENYDSGLVKLPPETKSHKEKAYQVKELIDQSSGKKMKLRDIIKIVGLSDTELQRTFKNEFGITVCKYQKNKRIEQAITLLISRPTWSINKISYEVGYADESSLSREFKKLKKMTPREYKRMQKK